MALAADRLLRRERAAAASATRPQYTQRALRETEARQATPQRIFRTVINRRSRRPAEGWSPYPEGGGSVVSWSPPSRTSTIVATILRGGKWKSWYTSIEKLGSRQSNSQEGVGGASGAPDILTKRGVWGPSVAPDICPRGVEGSTRNGFSPLFAALRAADIPRGGGALGTPPSHCTHPVE